MDFVQSMIRSYFEVAGIFGIVGLVFALALPVLLIAVSVVLASALIGSSRDKEWARSEVADWWASLLYYASLPFVVPVALIAEWWHLLKKRVR